MAGSERVLRRAQAVDHIMANTKAEQAVGIEQIRQISKWGVQTHPDWKWSLILGEEYGELQKAILEFDVHAVEECPNNECVAAVHFDQLCAEGLRLVKEIRIELTQTTAVGMSWLRDLNLKDQP